MRHPDTTPTEPQVQNGKADTNAPVEKLSYSVPETAQAVGTCPAMIYRAINSGKLKALKFGKRTLITPEAIKEWLASMDKYPTKQGGNNHD